MESYIFIKTKQLNNFCFRIYYKGSSLVGLEKYKEAIEQFDKSILKEYKKTFSIGNIKYCQFELQLKFYNKLCISAIFPLLLLMSHFFFLFFFSNQFFVAFFRR